MRQIFTYIFILFSCAVFSQESLNNLLNKLNKESVPYISTSELAVYKNGIVLLDAREPKEYKISHLKDAFYVGYDLFKLERVLNYIHDKNQYIVVYCSLGVRSEDIAEKLKKAGYTNVYNLYGGIFEWKNNNLPIYNSKEKETDSIHAFNEEWGKWLKKGKKVFNER